MIALDAIGAAQNCRMRPPAIPQELDHRENDRQTDPRNRAQHGHTLIVTDTYLGLFLAPFERIFGTVGLGNSTVREFITPIPKNTTAIQTVP